VPKLEQRLPDEGLDRRARLLRKLSPATLEGAIVKLTPLDIERDLETLHAASDGGPTSWGERRAGQVVERSFGSGGPPSTLLGVSVLGFSDQLVEIEAVAARR
jgi:hypothetical protein